MGSRRLSSGRALLRKPQLGRGRRKTQTMKKREMAVKVITKTKLFAKGRELAGVTQS